MDQFLISNNYYDANLSKKKYVLDKLKLYRHCTNLKFDSNLLQWLNFQDFDISHHEQELELLKKQKDEALAEEVKTTKAG